MVTKAISKRVNRSLWGGHLVIGPVLFLAAFSRKRPAQALHWLSITKKCSGILLTRLNGCASEDKANNSLVKSTNTTAPPSWHIYIHIYLSIYIKRSWKRLCAISSRARSHIATKPSQRIGTPTVECLRGGDDRKYASAEERAAKKQETTVRHFGFTEKVYGLPCTVRTLLLWKCHLEMPLWELTWNIYACDKKSYIDDVWWRTQ